MNITQFNKMIRIINSFLQSLEYNPKHDKIKFDLQEHSENSNPKKIIIEVDSAESVMSFLKYYKLSENITIEYIEELYRQRINSVTRKNVYLTLEIE